MTHASESAGRPAAEAARTGRRLLWIIAAAVLIRLVFVLFFSGFTEQDLGDSVRYNRVAKFMLERHAFWEYVRRPTAFAPPLYPAFLAGVYGLFGFHALAVKIIQAIAGGLLPWAVFATGRRTLGDRAALLAAAWTAFYPELIVITGYLYTETFFMLAAAVAFRFLLDAFRDDKRRDWALAGLFLGLSVLIRNLLYLFPGFSVRALPARPPTPGPVEAVHPDGRGHGRGDPALDGPERSGLP